MTAAFVLSTMIARVAPPKNEKASMVALARQMALCRSTACTYTRLLNDSTATKRVTLTGCLVSGSM